ncbi:MAG: type II toxin-antitoxin system VapC family toxin [Proteobacteria bacterium]|nr:type II toxin-antitoxin system VapC family toxin [Pseudomonadota bacterium]
MIFVDSNVFIYAVGRPHPLKESARSFFLESSRQGKRLVTSAEVLQEIIHVYLPVRRMECLDAALELAGSGTDTIFPINPETVTHARNLIDKHSELSARDLIHLSTCQQHKIPELMSFDRALMSAFKRT